MKYTGQLKQCIRHTYPDIDDDNSHSRPCRICKERKACITCDQSYISEKYVDCSFWLQHGTHDQKRYEHRHCTGKNKTKSPESFCSCSLSVDQKRKDHSENIIAESCKKCPDDRPSKNRPKGTSKNAFGIKQCLKIIKSHPVKQHQMVANTAIIGKCHTDHEHQWKYSKHKDECCWWCHKQTIQILMQKGFQIFCKCVYMHSRFLKTFCFICTS